jgi:hypothetical protein
MPRNVLNAYIQTAHLLIISVDEACRYYWSPELKVLVFLPKRLKLLSLSLLNFIKKSTRLTQAAGNKRSQYKKSKHDDDCDDLSFFLRFLYTFVSSLFGS